MINIQKFGALILALLLTLSFTGCSTPPLQDRTVQSPDNGNQSNDMPPDIDKTSADAEIVFKTPENVVNLVSLAVGDDANVYTATYEGIVSRYTPEGEFVREYSGTEFLCALQYYDGFIYGFNANTKDIVRLDPESGEIEVLYAGLEHTFVRGLSVSDGFLYLVAIPLFVGTYETGEDHYTNYNEVFLALDIENGELTEITEIAHPIALYSTSEDELYIYAHPQDSYVLYRYDFKAQKAEQITEMNDIGYLFSFAYEQNHCVYATGVSGVKAKKMPDGLAYIVADFSPVTYSGACFAYYRGNLVFLEQSKETGDNACNATQTLRLESDYVRLITPEEQEKVIEDRGNITVSVLGGNAYFNNQILYEKSGIKAVFSEQPQDLDKLQEFLTSIMAGDDAIDIYILSMEHSETKALMEQGGYASLNDSAPIHTYLDSCFDWVGESARTSDGDVWMLPLYYDMQALCYVPENFERFDLTPEDVSTFDKIM